MISSDRSVLLWQIILCKYLIDSRMPNVCCHLCQLQCQNAWLQVLCGAYCIVCQSTQHEHLTTTSFDSRPYTCQDNDTVPPSTIDLSRSIRETFTSAAIETVARETVFPEYTVSAIANFPYLAPKSTHCIKLRNLECSTDLKELYPSTQYSTCFCFNSDMSFFEICSFCFIHCDSLSWTCRESSPAQRVRQSSKFFLPFSCPRASFNW